MLGSIALDYYMDQLSIAFYKLQSLTRIYTSIFNANIQHGFLYLLFKANLLPIYFKSVSSTLVV